MSQYFRSRVRRVARSENNLTQESRFAFVAFGVHYEINIRALCSRDYTMITCQMNAIRTCRPVIPACVNIRDTRDARDINHPIILFSRTMQHEQIRGQCTRYVGSARADLPGDAIETESIRSEMQSPLNVHLFSAREIFRGASLYTP